MTRRMALWFGVFWVMLGILWAIQALIADDPWPWRWVLAATNMALGGLGLVGAYRMRERGSSRSPEGS